MANAENLLETIDKFYVDRIYSGFTNLNHFASQANQVECLHFFGMRDDFEFGGSSQEDDFNLTEDMLREIDLDGNSLNLSMKHKDSDSKIMSNTDKDLLGSIKEGDWKTFERTDSLDNVSNLLQSLEERNPYMDFSANSSLKGNFKKEKFAKFEVVGIKEEDFDEEDSIIHEMKEEKKALLFLKNLAQKSFKSYIQVFTQELLQCGELIDIGSRLTRPIISKLKKESACRSIFHSITLSLYKQTAKAYYNLKLHAAKNHLMKVTIQSKEMAKLNLKNGARNRKPRIFKSPNSGRPETIESEKSTSNFHTPREAKIQLLSDKVFGRFSSHSVTKSPTDPNFDKKQITTKKDYKFNKNRLKYPLDAGTKKFKLGILAQSKYLSRAGNKTKNIPESDNYASEPQLVKSDLLLNPGEASAPQERLSEKLSFDTGKFQRLLKSNYLTNVNIKAEETESSTHLPRKTMADILATKLMQAPQQFSPRDSFEGTFKTKTLSKQDVKKVYGKLIKKNKGRMNSEIYNEQFAADGYGYGCYQLTDINKKASKRIENKLMRVKEPSMFEVEGGLRKSHNFFKEMLKEIKSESRLLKSDI